MSINTKITETSEIDKNISTLLNDVTKKQHELLSTLFESTRYGITPPQLPLYELTCKLISNVFTNFTIGNLVGVQPMTGPVGIAKVLQATSSNDEILSLHLTHKPIEAKSLKMECSIPLETLQDDKSIRGKSQYIDTASSVIVSELTNMIINDLVDISGSPIKISYPSNNNILTDEIILPIITTASNNIKKSTKRGPANWLITTSPIISAFEDLSRDLYEPLSLVDFTKPLVRVGKLVNIDVYETKLDSMTNKILLGYNGSKEEDAGYIFCPYQVPAPLVGVITNDFEPVIAGIYIRFGTALNNMDDNENGITKASDYYQIIELDI